GVQTCALPIFFLIMNIGDAQVLDQDRNIRLPSSLSDTRPEYTALIKIDNEQIFPDGKIDATVPAVLASESDDVVALHAALDANTAERPLTEDEKPNGRAVTIMGDREMPYKVLKRVMA